MQNQIQFKLFMLWHTKNQQLLFSGLKKENPSQFVALIWAGKDWMTLCKVYCHVIFILQTCFELHSDSIYCLLPSPGTCVNQPFLDIIKKSIQGSEFSLLIRAEWSLFFVFVQSFFFFLACVSKRQGAPLLILDVCVCVWYHPEVYAGNVPAFLHWLYNN